MRNLPPSLLLAAAVAVAVDAFGAGLRPPIVARPSPPAAGSGSGRRARPLGAAAARGPSDELLRLLSDGGEGPDRERVERAVASLESSSLAADDGDAAAADDPGRFDPLLGLYEVKSVLTSNQGDNPVGGKWTREGGLAQRLFRTRTTFQHLLPPTGGGAAVAEAVNVVSLDALDGRLRITVILRGDAVPLSPAERLATNANRTLTPLTDLAVRAYFDPPRIYFGKRRGKGKGKGKGGEGYSYLPLQLGPSSSVVLDTTYRDDAVRIGMGGTSGTRFVFAATDDAEAGEYEALLGLRSGGSRWRALAGLGSAFSAGLCVATGRGVGFGTAAATRASRFAGAVAHSKLASAVLGVGKALKPWATAGLKIMAGTMSVLSGLAMILILFSSGGIERDGISRSPSPSP